MKKKELVELIADKCKQSASGYNKTGAKKHCNRYLIDQLRVIDKMVDDGYDGEIFLGITAPHSLIRMYANGVNLDQYCNLKQINNIKECHYGSDYASYTEMLEKSINLGLDTFMFKTYGRSVNIGVVERLYKLLVDGYNHTRDLDYSKLSDSEAVNYISAVSRGYNKGVALKYLRFVRESYQGSAYNLLMDSDNPSDALEVLKSDKTYSMDTKLQFIRLCSRLGIDMKENMYLLERRSFKESLTLMGLADGKFIPTTEEPYAEYLRDYLRMPGFDEYFKKYSHTRGHHKRLWALYEACHLSGIDPEEFTSKPFNLTTGFLLCLALGEDMSFYLSLNLNNLEFQEVIMALQNARPEIKDVLKTLIFPKIL